MLFICSVFVSISYFWCCVQMLLHIREGNENVGSMNHVEQIPENPSSC